MWLTGNVTSMTLAPTKKKSKWSLLGCEQHNRDLTLL